MDTPNSSPIISPITYLIVGVALLLAGAIIGAFTDPYLPASLSNAKKGYQSGFTAARTLVENSSLGAMFKIATDIRTLSGTVTAVGENNLTLHIPSGNPFADPALADRSIILSASTIVNNTVTKNIQGTTTSPKILPVEYLSIRANISDIKVGDIVNVFASDNIKMMKEFTASEVRILPKTPIL